MRIRNAGLAIIAAKWDVLTSRIDTRGPGAPVLVFNSLGWKRTDAASVDLGFGEGSVTGVTITDPEGQTVPSQVVDSTRYWDGSLKTARWCSSRRRPRTRLLHVSRLGH